MSAFNDNMKENESHHVQRTELSGIFNTGGKKTLTRQRKSGTKIVVSRNKAYGGRSVMEPIRLIDCDSFASISSTSNLDDAQLHWSKHTPLGGANSRKVIFDLISASSSTFLSEYNTVSMAGLSGMGTTAKKKRHLCAYTPSTNRNFASN